VRGQVFSYHLPNAPRRAGYESNFPFEQRFPP
jgi:hypothetical protein